MPPSPPKREKKFRRRCVECSHYFLKDDMFRIQLNQAVNKDMSNRSAYICKSYPCLQCSLQTQGKRIRRSLKHAVPKHFFEELERVLHTLDPSNVIHPQTI